MQNVKIKNQNYGIAEGDSQLNVALGDTLIFHFDF